MKKFLFLFIMLISLVSCGGSYVEPVNVRENLPSTDVFVQGSLLGDFETRSHGYGDAWPKVNAEEGWEAARFSIRIDGKIPGVINQPSNKYWGGFSGPNLGKVTIDYPYGHYDDRGFDYYKVDKATGENTGMFRYVFDSDGIVTESAIIEKPDMREVLTLLRDNSTNAKERAMLDEVLSSSEPLKIIWYVVKEVGMKNGWHVNGVLTHDTVKSVVDIPGINEEIEKDVKEYQFEESDNDPTKVKDNIEVDIHLQEHKDWNEIKTSIHIREYAGSIKVNIPLDYEYIVEQDDFDIRVYSYYYKQYEVIPVIEHNDKGITITINGIDEEFINTLKAKYGDGLTVEVHSYCTVIDEAWTDIKRSTVVTEYDANVEGQITSAYKPEEIVIIGN